VTNDKSNDPVPAEGWLSALVPTGLVPERQTQAFLGLRETYKAALTVAIDWQQQASRADWFETQTTVRGIREGRGYALMGQMGSVGEQLALAYAAKVEVVNWRQVASENETLASLAPEETTRIGLVEMCSRALSEVQASYLLALGHSLANVCIYALCLHDDLRINLATQFRHPNPELAFPPFSDAQQDWVSLTSDTSSRMRRSIRETSKLSEERRQVVLGLVAPTSELAASNPWRAVSEMRGDFFHRWRLQSHGLPGASKQTPWVRDVQGSRRLSVGARPRASDEARRFAERLDTSASELIQVAASAMEQSLAAWPDAFTALTTS
jgi:hypothetical protein